MTVRVAHFSFITYMRLLQKFEILTGQLILRLHPRRIRLNHRTQDKAEAEGPEQSANIEKENHSVLGKLMSVLVPPPRDTKSSIAEHTTGWSRMAAADHRHLFLACTSSQSSLFPLQTRR